MGWYGLLAIEGMAEAKAVVAHLRNNFIGREPDLPVVNAEPATLVSVLRELVRDPAGRIERGARGPAFVRRVHDTPVVGARLLAAYQETRARARQGARS